MANADVPTKAIDEKFCNECGAAIKRIAEICPKCGVRQMPPPAAVVQGATVVVIPGGRSKLVAALLAILLGGLGAHKFYMGKTGMGIFYLLFCWTFLPALFGLVEGLRYLVISDAVFASECASS